MSFLLFFATTNAQIVSAVRFGKNRVQTDRFDWRFIEAEKFTFQFYDSLHTNYVTELIKMCNEELNNLQIELDFEVPKHFNFLFYYSYEQYLQSNAGIQLDWYNTNELSRLTNNKIVLFYAFKTEDIRKQIRQGITRLILELILLNKEMGEQNQEETVGNFPKWFLYGLIAYKAESWNTNLDYDLKVLIEEEKYKHYKHFIADNPFFAGQTFWYYIETKYGLSVVENLISYLRNETDLNAITLKLFKTKYRFFISNIFEFFRNHYKKDNVKRKETAKGTTYTSTTFTKENIITIQANPNLKKGIYGIVQFQEGIYKVFVSATRSKRKRILKTGIRLLRSAVSQNYPLIAWKEDGMRLGVVFYDKTFLHFFEYDIIENTRKTELNLSDYFSFIQDFKYFSRGTKLLISGIRNGQSDIFVFDLQTHEIENITDDVYDDIDPSYVTFPGKIGILFSSNRSAEKQHEVENKKLNNTIEKENLKICIADYSTPKTYHHVSVLTQNQFGDARFPAAFTPTTFSYLSDENGIRNRYVGRFRTKRKGLDTVYKIDDAHFVNLTQQEKDSILQRAEKKQTVKTFYAVNTNDSSMNAPYTNYARSIIESKNVGGITPFVSDLKYTKRTKILYKSNVVEERDLLKMENRPLVNTYFIKSKLTKPNIQGTANFAAISTIDKVYQDSLAYFKNYFLSEFLYNPLAYADTFPTPTAPTQNVIEKVLNFSNYFNPLHQKYKFKFFLINFSYDLLNNDLMGEKYQPYLYGIGPIYMAGNNDIFNNMISFKAFDILEDINLTLGYKFPFNVSNPTSSFLAELNYLKYRVDYGLTYYRNIVEQPNGRVISNTYSFNTSYPFDILRRIKLSVGARRDFFNYKYDLDENKKKLNDSITWNALFKLDYVYDNTITPAKNIVKGLKFKLYGEYFFNLTKHNISTQPLKDIFTLNQNTFNVGVDIRAYQTIYKNIIWANRLSADMSFGNNKVMYYVGGTDGWLLPSFNSANAPSTDVKYNYQTLALNLRGHQQNATNGSNNIVFNTEVRAPILATVFRRPIAFAPLRNLQLITFFDAGIAWNKISNIEPVTQTFANEQVSVSFETLNLPFVAGYGFGARTSLSNYFIRVDYAYPVPSFFKNGIFYVSLGLDF